MIQKFFLIIKRQFVELVASVAIFILTMCGASLSAVAVAQAQPIQIAFNLPRAHKIQQPAEAAVSNDLSENWAGYTATKAATYSGVGASWAIPTPATESSSRLSADATWIGIGGVDSKNLIQTGTQAIVEDGDVTYEAWYEMLPSVQHVIPVIVRGSDLVTASLTETDSQQHIWALSFSNDTTGQTYTTKLKYDSLHASADWIEEMPVGVIGQLSGFLLLDDFGTVTFSNAYAIVNGTQQNLAQLNPQKVTMVVGGDQTLAIPTVIGTNNEFSVARTDAFLETRPQSVIQFRRSRPTGSDYWRVIINFP